MQIQPCRTSLPQPSEGSRTAKRLIPEKSGAQIPFPRDHHRSLQLLRFHNAFHAHHFRCIGSLPEIQPTFNTHRQRPEQQTIFRPGGAAITLSMLSEPLPPRHRSKNALRFVTFFVAGQGIAKLYVIGKFSVDLSARLLAWKPNLT
jgi:hypothetical protein